VINLLSTYGNITETPYFTVDSTQQAVPVLQQSGNYLRTKVGPTVHAQYFAIGDKIKVLSFGVCVPAPYAMARGAYGEESVSVVLVAVDNLNNAYNLTQQELPFGNYEISFGDLLEVPIVPGATKYRVQLLFTGLPKISMLNVPPTEDTKQYFLSCFAKIEHSIVMTVN